VHVGEDVGEDVALSWGAYLKKLFLLGMIDKYSPSYRYLLSAYVIHNVPTAVVVVIY